MNVWNRIATVLVASVGIASLAQAQSSPKATIYRLDAGSTLVEGCFDPCLCPLFFADNLRGTFSLRRVFTQDPLFDQTYVISDVNWLSDVGGTERRISGNGMFRYTTAAAGNLQEMVLQLSIDGEEPVEFNSGLVPGGAGDLFPSIDIAIDMNDQVCFDTVLGIQASPVPKDEISRFGVGGSSSFISGCFDPCLCPVVFLSDVRGSFDLVPLTNPASGIGEWALVNVDLQLPSLTPGLPNEATGAGILAINLTQNGVRQRVRMTLTKDAITDEFDSGLLPGPAGPPTALTTSVNTNNLVCFDTVYAIEARILN